MTPIEKFLLDKTVINMDLNRRYSDSSESHDSNFYNVPKTNKQQGQQKPIQRWDALMAQSDLNVKQSKLLENGVPCTTCQRICTLQCDRCGDFYCSVACQKKDWHSHRYICFPMPALVKQENFRSIVDENNVPNLKRTDNNNGKCLAYERQVLSNDFEINMLDNERRQNNATPMSNIQESKTGEKILPGMFNAQMNESKKSYSMPRQTMAAEKNLTKSNCQVMGYHNQKVAQYKGPLNTIIPKNESCIILTAFRTTNLCYIRSANTSDLDNYRTVIEKVQKCSINASKLYSRPKMYSYALTMHNNFYHRVQIVPCNRRDQYRVMFIDIGIFDFRVLKELYTISEALLLLPCQLKLIRLNGVDYVKDENVRKQLKEFENRQFKIQWVKECIEAKLFHWRTNRPLADDITKILLSKKQMINKEGKDDEESNSNERKNAKGNNAPKQKTSNSLNSSIVNLSNLFIFDEEYTCLDKVNKYMNAAQKDNLNNEEKYQKSKEQEEENDKSMLNSNNNSVQQSQNYKGEQQTCMKPPFKFQHFTENDENFTAIVVDNGSLQMGYVGCIMEKHLNNLINIQKYLKITWENTGVPYKPKLNEYCIAKYESDWYRAKVIQIKLPDQYTVVYIDFTNKLTLSSEDIRSYPMELTYNCTTNFCLIKDLLEEISVKQFKFLKDELSFRQPFHVDRIDEITNDATVLICNQLLDKVRDQ